MISVIRFYLMHLQTVLIKLGLASQFKFHIVSFENLKNRALKTYLAAEMSQKNA